jgi:hypothetical protein
VLVDGRRRLAPDLGADLALGAECAVRGVDVDPPDHDRGGGVADRGSLLVQGPAGVDGFAGMDGAWKLPVEPFPRGDPGHGRVDRAEPDRDRDQQGGRDEPRLPRTGFDRERREIAGDPGEQRDLRLGNGPSAGGPLATQREIVERKRLQIGPSIANDLLVPGVNL